MSGRSNRSRGHDFEVELANNLTEQLGIHIVTGRFFGLTYGADLVTVTGYDAHDRPVTYRPDVLGWSIEAKYVKRRAPSTWLDQAIGQAAPGTTPVVLWRRPRETGSAFLKDPEVPRGWRELPLDQFVRRLTEQAAA